MVRRTRERFIDPKCKLCLARPDDWKRGWSGGDVIRMDMVQNGWHYGRVAFVYRLRPLTEEELRTPGHPKNARMIESDPLTREVAVEVFARLDRGESMLSAARWLVSLPAARRGNRYWSNISVSALLRSPTYVARPHVGVEEVLSGAGALGTVDFG